MLFSLVISPVVWQYIGVFSTILAVLLFGMLLWRRREERRLEAMEASHTLYAWGMVLMAKILSAYAVGNYIGKDSVGRGIRELIAEIKEGGLGKILRKVGWKMVKNVFCKDADDRKELEKALAEIPVETNIDDAGLPSV